MTTQSNAQSKATGYIAALGAAGGVGGFILLIGGSRYRAWAVVAAVLVLAVALGVVAWLGGPTNP